MTTSNIQLYAARPPPTPPYSHLPSPPPYSHPALPPHPPPYSNLPPLFSFPVNIPQILSCISEYSKQYWHTFGLFWKQMATTITRPSIKTNTPTPSFTTGCIHSQCWCVHSIPYATVHTQSMLVCAQYPLCYCPYTVNVGVCTVSLMLLSIHSQCWCVHSIPYATVHTQSMLVCAQYPLCYCPYTVNVGVCTDRQPHIGKTCLTIFSSNKLTVTRCCQYGEKLKKCNL